MARGRGWPAVACKYDIADWASDPGAGRWQFENMSFTELFDRGRIEAILRFLEFCVENEEFLDADSTRESGARIRAILGRCS